jgi:hypothetical protein
MNYAESKKKIDKIRQEYGCKGEVLFRTAIQYVVEYGKDLLNDDSWFKGEIISIDAYHDKAEMEGKTLWITRGFEKSILECAKELAQIEAYDLLMYIQREVWLGGEVGEPDYQRAMEIIQNCLSYIADCYGAYHSDDEETLGKFLCVMNETEIEYFGYGELLDAEYEEENE